jgi:hypothetical protein
MAEMVRAFWVETSAWFSFWGSSVAEFKDFPLIARGRTLSGVLSGALSGARHIRRSQQSFSLH